MQPEPPEGQTLVKTEPPNQTPVSASETEDHTEQLKTLANQVAQQVTEKVTQQVVQTLTDQMDKGAQDKLDIAPANAVTHPRVKNYREMEVITPDGVLRYVWRTRDSEPVIIADEDQETKTSQNSDGEPAKIALQK